MQCEVQCGYSERACSFINHRLLAPAQRQPGNVRQVRTTTSCSSSYHGLLFNLLSVHMDYNCTRTGFEIHACIVLTSHIRKKNSFHKLIRVIQIFMRKLFMVQYYISTKYY